MSRVREVRKRDHRVVPFDRSKIAHAIHRALRSVGEGDRSLADELSEAVVHFLEERFSDRIPGIEEIQDVVETVLMELGHPRVAKSYILYRQKRATLRESLVVRKDRPREEGVSYDYSAAEGRRREGVDLDGLPRVEEDFTGSGPWSKRRVVAALVREADLDVSVAEEIASTVERKVIESGIRRISTSLIRELVDNELFERGFRAKLRKQQPIGLPRYNLEQVIFGTDSEEGFSFPKDPSEVRRIIANRVLHQFSLSEVFGPGVADAHREGRVFLHRLSDPIRLARLTWSPLVAGATLASGDSLAEGALFDRLLLLEPFFSEELRVRGIEPLASASGGAEVVRTLTRRLSSRFARRGEGPDLVLEIDVDREKDSALWLEALAELDGPLKGGFAVALRLPSSAGRLRDWPGNPALGRLFARGDSVEFLPPRHAEGGTPEFWAAGGKITINLPRAAYRSSRDRRGSIESELDRAVEIAVKGLLERRRFAARLAEESSRPLWEIFGSGAEGEPILDGERDVVYSVGVVGLNECVEFLSGRSLHQGAEASELGRRLIAHLARRLRRESRGLGLVLRLEETGNLGPLEVLERADRRRYPDAIGEVLGGAGETARGGYSDGVRLARDAPVDPLARLQALAAYLGWIHVEGGVVEEVPELREPESELLSSLLEEGIPALVSGTMEKSPGAAGIALPGRVKSERFDACT